MTGPWIGRQALHAGMLGLNHPLTGQPLTFRAPLPEDFAAALAALGLPPADVAQLEAFDLGSSSGLEVGGLSG